ncbi:MAG: hypothetical protein MKZ59_07995 [Deinococcales bacterium]|nr:hypothetical protein [Deinococcales bacterium]
MGSSRQTGLLLVIGTIVAAIGWFVLYLPLAGGSPDTSTAQVAQNMIDSATRAHWAVIFAYGGFISILVALAFVARGMAMGGGAGAGNGNIGMILFLLFSAGVLIVFGLEWGAAGASSVEHGTLFLDLTGVISTGGQIVLAIALALTTLGLLSEGNNPIAPLVLIVAAVLLALNFVWPGIGAWSQFGAWILFMLGTLILGIQTLGNSDS